jgi:hypothetical protein
MKRLLSFCAMLGVAISLAPSAASAQQAKRTLVFNFTVGIQNTTRVSDSSDQANFNHSGTDKGQIIVGIAGVEADGGLVTTVEEKAQNGRSSAPTTCVVYPNTNIVCASTGVVQPEEYSVLRPLSPKFFDPTALDAKRHWHVGDGPVSIDFTATPQSSGLIAIDSTRSEKMSGSQRGTVDSTAKYMYDLSRFTPVSMSEYQTIRSETGAGTFGNLIVDFSATLASDSATKF